MLCKNKSCGHPITTYFTRNLLGTLSENGRRPTNGATRTKSNCRFFPVAPSQPIFAGGIFLFLLSLISPLVCLRCGVLLLGLTDEQFYASKAYNNDVALGVRTVKFDFADSMRTVFPDNLETGPSFEGTGGYLNLDSGWAFATRGIQMLMARVIALGGKVMGGKVVTGLVRDEDGRTSGVILADGSSIDASLVVIASGSWTPSTFRDLDLDKKCISTG